MRNKSQANTPYNGKMKSSKKPNLSISQSQVDLDTDYAIASKRKSPVNDLSNVMGKEFDDAASNNYSNLGGDKSLPAIPEKGDVTDLLKNFQTKENKK